MLGAFALIATLSLMITAAPNGWLIVGGVIVGIAAASTIPSSPCRTDALHRPCESPRPFTWTKTADEILKSSPTTSPRSLRQPPRISERLKSAISGASH